MVDSRGVGQILPPNHTALSPRWCAPELLDKHRNHVPHPTFSTDIYSLASTMFEVFSQIVSLFRLLTDVMTQIFTGRTPFYEAHYDHLVVLWKIKGDIPERPTYEMAPELTDNIWVFMEHCWSFDPNTRPTIDEVINWLRVSPAWPQQNTNVQESIWRPEVVWTEAEMRADRAFLVDFVSQSFLGCLTIIRLTTSRLTSIDAEIR